MLVFMPTHYKRAGFRFFKLLKIHLMKGRTNRQDSSQGIIIARKYCNIHLGHCNVKYVMKSTPFSMINGEKTCCNR